MTANHPLRLAVGSHRAGSGRGCAMNVISWENGDAEITDLPDCADPMLAHVVQNVNDTICAHRNVLLCPECSIKVLDLAHRTVGTANHGLPADDLHRVQVTIAVEHAESVAHLDPTPEGAAARAVVRHWLAGEATADECRTAAGACVIRSATAPTAAWSATAAAYAAGATCDTTCDTAADDAVTYAARAARDDLLTRAHAAIDRFLELAPPVRQWTPTLTTPEAIAAMCEVAR